MESQIFNFISALVENGTITDAGLLLIIILMICALSYYVLRPIYNKIQMVPSKEDVQEIIKAKIDIEEKHLEEIGENISKKLDKMSDLLDGVEDLGKGSYREVKELKKDIEQIKQILNQFQGHLMYGGKTSSFGNRELR
jgi:hypothetical protein